VAKVALWLPSAVAILCAVAAATAQSAEVEPDCTVETLAKSIAFYLEEAQLVTSAEDYPEMRTKLELLRTSPELQAHFLNEFRWRAPGCLDHQIMDALEPAVDKAEDDLE
jgi:hypothetical protein